MKTRQTYIWKDKSYSAVGTETIDIRVKDPITRLLFYFGVTLTTGARLTHISGLFTKIALVDGSEVLMSLAGPQMDGIARLDKIHNPAMFGSNNINSTDCGNLIVNFGRRKWDKQFAFDPTRFINPQLQITYDWTKVQAAASGCDFAVIADVMEGMSGAPGGFLMKKEIKSWSATSGAHEYTQLPRDYKYRRLFLQALTKAVGVGAHWSNAKLSEDNDKRIPFDIIVDDQIAENAIDYGIIIEDAGGNLSSASYPVFLAPTYAPSMSITCQAATSALANNKQDGGQFTPVTSGGSDSWNGVAHGLCPQGLVAFDFGDIDSPDDFYDPQEIGDLQLDVTGAGSHTIHLILEQLRTY